MKKEEILKYAEHVRKIILDEFPDNRNFDKQCKRASILIDLLLKKNNIPSYINAGHITKEGDTHDYDRGHVWNVVCCEDDDYILDITLTQFKDYLSYDVPVIVFTPEHIAEEKYSYVSDGYGEYEYQKEDVRKSLLEKI